MLIAGLDEAGKGPVLGDLVVGCVVFEKNKLQSIKGLKDSKKLSRKRREALYAEILETAHEVLVVELSSQALNHMHDQGKTINEMDVQAFSLALDSLDCHPEIVYLDAADVNEERFGRNVVHSKLCEVISKHKADELFPIVSAASIIAKVHRDGLISKIAERYGKDVGSGYPGDAKTRGWLRDYYYEHGKFPPEARKFWKTLEKLKPAEL